MQIDKYKKIIDDFNDDNKKDLNNDLETKRIYEIFQKNNIVTFTKKGTIKKNIKNKLKIGKLDKKENFGFIIVDGEEDYFTVDSKNYLNNDYVLFYETFDKRDKNKKRRAKIIDCVERNNDYLLVRINEKHQVVTMNGEYANKKIIVDGIDLEQLRNGTVFSINIKSIKNDKIITKLNNIISDENDPDLKMKMILDQYDIKVEFDNVEEELALIEEEINEEEINKRIDLREQIFFTIDGDDSKDLDDAISLIKEGEKYRLFVAIADVSHYIKEGTQLDKNAQERATSIYFVDRVVPMLPKKISNGICSLHANVDRLVMVCEMLINPSGQVEEKKIYQGVINSNYRLTYNKINSLLMDHDKEILKEYNLISSILFEMNKLAKILKKNRFNRGAFNLEDTDAKFKVDDKGKIIDIYAYQRQDAEKLIEEFMILANESVTEYVDEQKKTFLYRVHGNPNPNKLKVLKDTLDHLGIKSDIDYENVDPKEFKKIFDQVEDDSFKRILSKIIVRSMAKAVYTTENIGHFGLASKHYTHFTSPIRRYPDLEVHRLLKHYISVNAEEEINISEVNHIAEHSSECEIKAIKAENDIEDYKKAEYMKQFIGKKFKGIISSIEDYGMFIELENTIRGLIRFNELENYKSSNKFKVIFTDKELKFGDELEVILSGVNLDRGLIDFVPDGFELKKIQKENNKKNINNKNKKNNKNKSFKKRQDKRKNRDNQKKNKKFNNKNNKRQRG